MISNTPPGTFVSPDQCCLMIVTRIQLQDIKIHHSKVMVDNLKKIDMKLPILELAQLKNES